jgi:hypothetical protein
MFEVFELLVLGSSWLREEYLTIEVVVRGAVVQSAPTGDTNKPGRT